MFESMTDRIAGTVLMGLDVAVEFATLGEFRLVDADAPAPDDFRAAPLVRRPARLETVATNTKLLPPASTAIARAAAESAARVAARRRKTPHLDELFTPRAGAKAVIPSAPRRRPASGPGRVAASGRPQAKPAPRKRAGAVESGTQLCLFAHAEPRR
jgi:hypothetical protein